MEASSSSAAAAASSPWTTTSPSSCSTSAAVSSFCSDFLTKGPVGDRSSPKTRRERMLLISSQCKAPDGVSSPLLSLVHKQRHGRLGFPNRKGHRQWQTNGESKHWQPVRTTHVPPAISPAANFTITLPSSAALIHALASPENRSS